MLATVSSSIWLAEKSCREGEFFLERGDHPNFEKNAPRIWAEIQASNPIPRVAPRVAPRIGFSHKFGRECHSENCSENTPEFRELLREWPFHSESVFFKNWGGSQVSEFCHAGKKKA